MTNKITKSNKRENLVNDLQAKCAKDDLKGIWKSIKLAANLPTTSNLQSKNNEHLNAQKLNDHFCSFEYKSRIINRTIYRIT